MARENHIISRIALRLKSDFYLFIITQSDLEIADPRSTENACVNGTSLLNMTSLPTSLPVVQWLDHPTGVWKVMGPFVPG